MRPYAPETRQARGGSTASRSTRPRAYPRTHTRPRYHFRDYEGAARAENNRLTLSLFEEHLAERQQEAYDLACEACYGDQWRYGYRSNTPVRNPPPGGYNLEEEFNNLYAAQREREMDQNLLDNLYAEEMADDFYDDYDPDDWRRDEQLFYPGESNQILADYVQRRAYRELGREEFLKSTFVDKLGDMIWADHDYIDCGLYDWDEEYSYVDEYWKTGVMHAHSSFYNDEDDWTGYTFEEVTMTPEQKSKKVVIRGNVLKNRRWCNG
jgi:hypothetical protein